MGTEDVCDGRDGCVWGSCCACVPRKERGRRRRSEGEWRACGRGGGADLGRELLVNSDPPEPLLLLRARCRPPPPRRPAIAAPSSSDAAAAAAAAAAGSVGLEAVVSAPAAAVEREGSAPRAAEGLVAAAAVRSGRRALAGRSAAPSTPGGGVRGGVRGGLSCATVLTVVFGAPGRVGEESKGSQESDKALLIRRRLFCSARGSASKHIRMKPQSESPESYLTEQGIGGIHEHKKFMKCKMSRYLHIIGGGVVRNAQQFICDP